MHGCHRWSGRQRHCGSAASCNGTDAQKWFYNSILGTMQSGLAGNFCLTTPNGNTANHTQLQISECVEEDVNQMFDKNGNKFNSRLNANQLIDASGTNSGLRDCINSNVYI